MHDIGKNMVAMLIESAGFEVKDLGVDVSSDVFVDTIKEIKPQVVGLSCLLTTTMVNMKGIVGSIKEATPDDDFKNNHRRTPNERAVCKGNRRRLLR